MDSNDLFGNMFGDNDEYNEAELINSIQVQNRQYPYEPSASELRDLPAHASNDGFESEGNADFQDEEVDDEANDDDDDDEFEEELIIDDELRLLVRQMANVTDDELQNLIAYNASYLEIIESLIAKTDRALDENRETQEDIHERLANKTEDTKPYSISVAIYMRPYFKDRHGMPPPMNDETKLLRETHLLTTPIREEMLWREEDYRKLREAVREQLLRQMTLRLESRKSLLEDKIKSFDATNTDDDLESWRSEIKTLDRKIVYTLKLPDDEIFTGDYSKISWNEISVRNFNVTRSGTACRQRWMNEQRPKINRTPWTTEEDEQLHEASNLSFINWKFAAHELGSNRNEFQCFCRAKELEQKYFIEKQMWSSEDDEKLISIVFVYNNIDSIPWEKVAKLMGNRNTNECRRRFQYSLNMSVHIGRWTHAEDMFLLEAVNHYGPYDWDRIASCVPGRSAPQCRSRWSNVLDSKRNVQNWTIEEDEMILTAVRFFGRGRWSEISQLLSNRHPADVRSRFRRFLNRKIRDRPPYDLDANDDHSIWNQFSRRQDVLTRFQVYETFEAEKLNEENDFAKRFGIGAFILNRSGQIQVADTVDDERRKQFGDVHAYATGIWKKRLTVDEVRLRRFEKLNGAVPQEIRLQLEEFQIELSERKRLRDLECEEFSSCGEPFDHLLTKYKEEDIDRVKQLMDEVIVVRESDLDQQRKRRLPRIRIRRRKIQRRGKKVKPSDVKRLALVRSETELVEKCELIREMRLTPEMARLLNLPEERIYRKDGTKKRIAELVLMEDEDNGKYWVTDREAMILRLMLNLNKHLVSSSMYFYEKHWRLDSVKRSTEYYRDELTFEEVPAVYENSKEESPPLIAFCKLISDCMLPCRGNLTALHQYRARGRGICTTVASGYFDQLDENGSPVAFTEFSNQRLDIELPQRVLNSVDYLLLRARMFKMFFLPMLLQHGQRSPEAKLKILQEIQAQQVRRQRERIFEETNDESLGVSVFEDDTLIVGRTSTVSESEIPGVYKRIMMNSNKIDTSIDSVLTNAIASASKPKAKGRRRKDAMLDDTNFPSRELLIPSNLQILAPPEPERSESVIVVDETPPPKKVPKKRGRKRKADMVISDLPPESILASAPAIPTEVPSTSSVSNIQINNLEVVALRPEVVKDKSQLTQMGAYQPRWVTKKQKEMEQSGEHHDGELTLADLLFVRGKKRRAAKGFYNQQHSEMVFESIRSRLDEVEAPENEEQSETNAIQRIKQELAEQ